LLDTGYQAAPKYLEPGEQLIVAVPARTGRAIVHYIGLAGIEPFLGDFLQEHYFAYLTNRRLLLVRESSFGEKPGSVEMNIPIAHLRVSKFKQGRTRLAFPTLVLRFDGKALRLNFEPPYSSQASELAEGITKLGKKLRADN
jgi:hypothetical protein